MSLQNKIKTAAIIAFASMALKSATAQNNKSTKSEFKGVTVTPAAFAAEVSDGVTYPYIANTATLNFGLNKKFDISPYLNVSGGLCNIWNADNGNHKFTKRFTVNLGAAKNLDAFGIFADAGIGAMDTDPFYQFNVGIARKIYKLNKDVDINAFISGYYEKFNKYPFAIGICGGISISFNR